MFLLTVFKDHTGNGCTKLAGTHLISQTCCSLFTEVLLAKVKALPSECLLFASDPLKCKNYFDTLAPEVKICLTGSDVVIQEATVSSSLICDHRHCVNKA